MKNNYKTALMDSALVKKYQKVEHAFDTYWFCKLNNKWGLIDENGKEFIPPIYLKLEFCPTHQKDNRQIFFYATKKSWGNSEVKGVIDINNRIMIAINYKDVRLSPQSLFFIINSGSEIDCNWSINFDGERITKSDELRYYGNKKRGIDYIVTREDSVIYNYGLYDHEGNQKVEFKYDFLNIINDDAIIVGEGNKTYKIIEEAYQEQWYDLVTLQRYDGRFGVINFDSEVLVPLKYRRLLHFWDSYFYCSSYGRWSKIYSEDFDCGYEYLSDQWGITNTRGELIVAQNFNFKTIERIGQELKAGKHGPPDECLIL